METLSQNTRILEHLQNGLKLTAYDALIKFGCLRLASRICELKNQGHEIASEKIELSNGKRVSRYSIIQGGTYII